MLVHIVEQKEYNAVFDYLTSNHREGEPFIQWEVYCCYLLATVIFNLRKVPHGFRANTLVQWVCLPEMRRKPRRQSEVSAFVQVHEVSPPSVLGASAIFDHGRIPLPKRSAANYLTSIDMGNSSTVAVQGAVHDMGHRMWYDTPVSLSDG